jgi:hypothetical protein
MNKPLPHDTTLKVPQDRDTPLTALETPVGAVLYLYARSADSVSSQTIGQDYVVFRWKEDALAFAVCDGVGQSFMGDLAARVLGDALLEWLWQIDRPADAAAFATHLEKELARLISLGAKTVAEFKLPPRLPLMLVQALENQRAYGSESMFVAGRLSTHGSDTWAALCWLGDSPVAAIDVDGELIDLGPRGHTSERWNALTGLKGSVHTWVSSGQQRIARVAGYTDGLGQSHAPTDAELAALMKQWQESPPVDDASLVDVRLAPSPQTVGKATEQPPFTSDPARPISLSDPQRTPLSAMQPLEDIPPGKSSVEGWRPLGKNQTQPPGDLLSGLDDLSEQQQIRVWQQAALLGLTSAALSLMMLERLIRQQEQAVGKDDPGK